MYELLATYTFFLDFHSSLSTQPGHFKQTPSLFGQHLCSCQILLRTAPTIKLPISICCLDPDMAPRQCQQPDDQTSLRAPRSQRSQCGRHFYYPKSLKFVVSYIASAIPSHIKFASLPISFSFLHLNRTVISWKSRIRLLNNARSSSDSCESSSLMYFGNGPSAKMLFQPVTGLVRTTG